MTDKAPVTVEQGDRQMAAHEFVRRYGASVAEHLAVMDDSNPLVQAFAAHRLQSIAALEEEIRRLRLAVAAQECLQDSAYKAGVKHGWNLCVADDEDGYQRIANGTEHIAELKRIREARTALEGRGS